MNRLPLSACSRTRSGGCSKHGCTLKTLPAEDDAAFFGRVELDNAL